MKTLRIFFIAALSAAVFAACSGNGSSSGNPANAATVGTTAITTVQLAKEVKILQFIAGLNKQQCGAAASATGVPAAGDPAACSREALSNLISDAYVNMYAAANKITVAPADVQKSISQIDTQIGAAAIDTALKANGLTRTDLTGLAQRFLLFNKVQSAVESASVTNAQLQALYKKNIGAFTNADLDHILVKTKAEAEKVYQQVTAPGFTQSDFEALAKKVSTDPGVAQNSGHYAQTVSALPGQQGGFVQPFADAVLALQPGEVSKPVQSQYGWHVILLNSKTVTPFAQAKAQLLQSVAGSSFSTWMTAQATAKPVTVNPKYGMWDVATLQVVPVTSTASGSASAASPAGSAPASSAASGS